MYCVNGTNRAFYWVLGGVLSGGFAGWVAAHVTEPTWCVVTWAQEVIIDVVWDKVQ
jgi:hypothetical protein